MNHPAPTLESVSAALDHIPPDIGHDERVRLAFAVFDAVGDAGADLWLTWAGRRAKPSPSDDRATWKSARKRGPVTAATLFGIARDHGYKPEPAAGPAHKPSPGELKAQAAARRSLLSNMVEGVTKGFEKKLEIIGVGYKAQVSGSKLMLNLGHSHPIDFPIPAGLKIEIDKDKKNILAISGANKELVGEVAAKIRSFRKPEPYKGKGIRYLGEHIVRKAGKAASKDK